MKALIDTTRIYYKNHSVTFNSSSSFQSFTVPNDLVGAISVDCVASRGWNYDSSYKGGAGGRVQCKLSITKGTTLYIMVGSSPSAMNEVAYNASDIRTNNSGLVNTTSLNSRLVVAGGGGNAFRSGLTKYSGGAGGGTTGGNGGNSSSSNGGVGGTQSNGGYYYGALGVGGCYGVNQGSTGTGDSDKAAGGAGLYGGGGSSPSRKSAGGGGSSYANPNYTSNVVHTQGYRDGTGYITITYQAIGTAQDYDSYKDITIYKVIKEEENGQADKYLAMK